MPWFRYTDGSLYLTEKEPFPESPVLANIEKLQNGYRWSCSIETVIAVEMDGWWGVSETEKTAKAEAEDFLRRKGVQVT